MPEQADLESRVKNVENNITWMKGAIIALTIAVLAAFGIKVNTPPPPVEEPAPIAVKVVEEVAPAEEAKPAPAAEPDAVLRLEVVVPTAPASEPSSEEIPMDEHE